MDTRSPERRPAKPERIGPEAAFVAILALIAVMAAAAYFQMKQAEVPSGPPPASPTTDDFGVARTLTVGETVTMSDGLTVRLARIDDSRCAPGVVCIWQGELSALLTVDGGSLTEEREVRLGTEQSRSATAGEYLFVLDAATETTATIRVERGQE